MYKVVAAAAFMIFSANPTWFHNLEDARSLAKKEHKLILLNFSGSDWCIPCISLHKDIFESSAFSRFAGDNLILVNADFPRKKKNQLSADQQRINDALAERYNPEGNFPFTLLLDSDGNKIKTWDGYYKNGVDNFITEIKRYQEP